MSTEWSEQGSEQERIRADVNHFGAKLTEFIYRPTNNEASDIESGNRRLQMESRMSEFLHQTGSPSTWRVQFRVPEESENPTATTIQILGLHPEGSDSFDEVVEDTFTYTADDDEGIVVGPDGITDQTSLSYMRLIREGLLEVVDEVIANPNPSTEKDLDPVITGFSALRSAGTRLSRMRRIVDDVQGNLSQYRLIRERREHKRERDTEWKTTPTKLEDPTGAPLPVEAGQNVDSEANKLLVLRTQIASRIALRSALVGMNPPADQEPLLDDVFRELLEQVKEKSSSPDQEQQDSAHLRGIIDAILTGDDIAHGEIDALDAQTQQTIRNIRDKITIAATYRPPYETDMEADLKAEAAELRSVLSILAEGNIPNLSKLTPQDRNVIVRLGAKIESGSEYKETIEAALKALVAGEPINDDEIAQKLGSEVQELLTDLSWKKHFPPSEGDQGKESETREPISQETIDETRNILDNDLVIGRRKEMLTKELDDISKRDIFAQLETRVGMLSIANPSLNPTAVFAYLDNLRREMGVVLFPRDIGVINAATATDFFKAALRSAQGGDEEGQERALNLLKQLHKAPLK